MCAATFRSDTDQWIRVWSYRFHFLSVEDWLKHCARNKDGAASLMLPYWSDWFVDMKGVLGQIRRKVHNPGQRNQRRDAMREGDFRECGNATLSVRGAEQKLDAVHRSRLSSSNSSQHRSSPSRKPNECRM